jgi:hypothetical protein
MTNEHEQRVRQLLAAVAARVTSSPPDPARLRSAAGAGPGRVRSRRWLPAVAAAVAVVAIAGGIAWSTRGGSHPSSPAAANTPVSSASPSLTHVTTGVGTPVPSTVGSGISVSNPCTGSDLRSSLIGGAAGSQPYVIIGLTNTASTACRLGGAPTIAAYSTATSVLSGQHALSIRQRQAFDQPQDGGPVLPGTRPTMIELQPGSTASFTITTSAPPGSPNLVDIRTIGVTVPGDGQAMVVELPGDEPLPAALSSGQPISVGVTNFAAALGGHAIGSAPRVAQ